MLRLSSMEWDELGNKQCPIGSNESGTPSGNEIPVPARLLLCITLSLQGMNGNQSRVHRKAADKKDVERICQGAGGIIIIPHEEIKVITRMFCLM